MCTYIPKCILFFHLISFSRGVRVELKRTRNIERERRREWTKCKQTSPSFNSFLFHFHFRLTLLFVCNSFDFRRVLSLLFCCCWLEKPKAEVKVYQTKKRERAKSGFCFCNFSRFVFFSIVKKTCGLNWTSMSLCSSIFFSKRMPKSIAARSRHTNTHTHKIKVK